MAEKETKLRIFSEREREDLVATREPQKLFRQALDTLPAQITYWKMVLTAPRIPHPYH